MVPAQPPDPTLEYDALAPQPGESAMDALARVGAALVGEVEHKDASRPATPLPRQLAALVALRAEGYDNHEIAERLKIKPKTLTKLIAKVSKTYGWSDFADKIAHQAVPQAVDNLLKHLEHEGTKKAVTNGQHALTRRTLEGTGLFRNHSAIKQESKTEQTNILRVEIVLPTLDGGAAMPALADGSVLATPRKALPDIPVTPEPSHAL